MSSAERLTDDTFRGLFERSVAPMRELGLQQRVMVGLADLSQPPRYDFERIIGRDRLPLTVPQEWSLQEGLSHTVLLAGGGKVEARSPEQLLQWGGLKAGSALHTPDGLSENNLDRPFLRRAGALVLAPGIVLWASGLPQEGGKPLDRDLILAMVAGMVASEGFVLPKTSEAVPGGPIEESFNL